MFKIFHTNTIKYALKLDKLDGKKYVRTNIYVLNMSLWNDTKYVTNNTKFSKLGGKRYCKNVCAQNVSLPNIMKYVTKDSKLCGKKLCIYIYIFPMNE